MAEIDGTEFRVPPESLGRERAFGEASIRVTRRGRNAVLAAPYAPVMTFTNSDIRTARQLLHDVLTHDGTATGIPLGWTVDFGLTDWTVPAGVFSHQGHPDSGAVGDCGGGGRVCVPHLADQRLGIRSRFPVSPWERNNPAQYPRGFVTHIRRQVVCDHLNTILTGISKLITRLEPPDPPEFATIRGAIRRI